MATRPCGASGATRDTRGCRSSRSPPRSCKAIRRSASRPAPPTTCPSPSTRAACSSASSTTSRGPRPVAADDPLELEIKLLLDAILARYGYDLRAYAPESMRRRVLHLLDKFGLEHLGVLQNRIVHDAAFMSLVLGELTVRTS